MLETDTRIEDEVRDAIVSVFKRNAETEAAKINIEAREGRVVLQGTVRSYAEREDAERAAQDIPGVVSVDDQIAIEVVAHLTAE